MGIEELSRQTLLLPRRNNGFPGDFGFGVGIREAVALGMLPGWAVRGVQGLVIANASGEFELYPLGTVPVRPSSPAAAGTLQVFSSDATDEIAGTGARVVVVEYLDGDGFERVGIVDMDGTSAAPVNRAQQSRGPKGNFNGGIEIQSTVIPVTDCYRVLTAYVQLAGASDVNDGIIIVIIGADGQTAIAAGMNRSRHAFFAVPRGQVGFVTGVGSRGGEIFASKKIRAQARTLARGPGVSFMSPWQLMQTFELGASGGPVTELPAWRRVKPLGEVRMLYQKPDSSNESIIGGFDIITSPDSNNPDPAFNDAPELLPARMG